MSAMAIPTMAAENVDGADAGNFGKPTSVEQVTTVGGGITESDNVNRSKDSAFIPPSFGSPSSNTPNTGEYLTPNIAGTNANSGTAILPPGSSSPGSNSYIPADGNYPPVIDTGSNTVISNKFTLPDGLYYSDGSIGTLSISKLKLSAKVYEDESLENMKKGVGHFKSTSCWDGNVGFAAHNRGAADFFGEIHTLVNGDKITYTTKLGTRTYEVFFVGKIHETDFSRLGRTDENIVTLTTCVRDVPELRWCVQAREIR